MIDYKYWDLFLENSIPKQILISFDGATLTNEDLYNQELSLEESLCSLEELRFGCCEASVLKFKISDIFSPMVGKWLEVKMVLDGNSSATFIIGRYKVDSDTLSADRRYREVVAYDAMYDIINSSAIGWYNTILPNNDSKVTMRQFRTSFVESFGLKQRDIMLANDDMVVEKTIRVGEGTEIDSEEEQVSILKESSLSGLDVITKICEINGCFGHIGRDGKFHYIYLKQDIGGLYPSDDLFPDHAPEHLSQSKTGHLYPQSPNSYRIDKSKYISCDWENFFTKRITKLQIRNGENDIGKVYPDGRLRPEDNCYIVEGNFLLYGKTDAQLSKIAENLFGKITDISYMPFSADTIGNPCLEVGDAIRIPTTYDIVESYVLQRALKGIQALRDNIKASGIERYVEKVNGVQRSIIQLRGRTNTLIRNVDETRSELELLEADTDGRVKTLSSSISQTAKKIELEVSERKEGEESLSSRISQTIDTIDLSVENGDKSAGIRITLKKEGDEEATTKEAVGRIDMTGLVSFSNLENSGETTINGGNIVTDSIDASKIKTETLYLENELRIKRVDSDGVARERIALWMEDVEGQTAPNVVVGGKNWQTNVVIKDSLDCLSQTNFGANVTMEKTLDVSGDISTSRYVYFDKMGAKRGIATQTKGGTSTNGDLIAGMDADNVTSLIGAPSNSDTKTTTLLRGNTVKLASAGSVTTSDERLKNSFKPLDEFDSVYMDIEPCAFRYNNGTSGRYHFGAKAQGVKAALEKHGYTTKDFGGFVQSEDSPENEDYCGVDDPMGLIYTEFTMWNMHMVQELYRKVGWQQEEIETLKEIVSSLLRKDGRDEQSI